MMRKLLVGLAAVAALATAAQAAADTPTRRYTTRHCRVVVTTNSVSTFDREVQALLSPRTARPVRRAAGIVDMELDSPGLWPNPSRVTLIIACENYLS